MDSVAECVMTWIMREEFELDTLSEWVKSIRFLILCRIHKLKFCVKARPTSVFQDKKANDCLSSLDDKYGVSSKESI